MLSYILNPWRVQTLLAIAGIPRPIADSPLRILPTYPRSLERGDPDWEGFEESGLVAVDPTSPTGWRMNSVLAAVLNACAQPEEVINIGVGDSRVGGFSVCRRGPLWSECTVDATGNTKFSFPLSRSQVMLMLIEALTGDTTEASSDPSKRFRFRGPAAEAFVLATALREWRADETAIDRPTLHRAVALSAATPELATGFLLDGHAGTIDAMASDARVVDAAIDGLRSAGHLVARGKRMAPSPRVLGALGAASSAVFSISHVEVDAAGRGVSRLLQAMRVGDRTLTYRPVGDPGRAPIYEWAEVDQRELRILVAAMLSSDQELEAFATASATRRGKPLAATATATASATKSTAAKKATAKKATANPAPAKKAAPKRQATPLPPQPTGAWSPTHLVPSGGLPAWEQPDPTLAPAATLDPRLDVRVIGRNESGWANIECSNGWSAWVDGAQLEEVSS